MTVPTDEPTTQEPSITDLAAAMRHRADGQTMCQLGQHAYTPWTPPDDNGVSLCWCARACGYYVRSDELR